MPRSVAEQAECELGGPASVLSRRRRDHARLDALLSRLEATTGRAQQEVLRRVDRLVVAHAFAEERVLWPEVRRVLPDGEELTRRGARLHREVDGLIAALGEGGLDDPRRPERLARLVEVLRQDVRDEEDVRLPRLQERLDPHELRRLGRQWELVRRIAPTRPRPAVGRRPPGGALAALPLSVLDRTRDLVHAGVRRGPARLAPVGAAVSRGLAGVAARVARPPASR
ncbi:hemerythrin domain-containing protein [Blastococcus sp. SYSU D00695]